MPAPTITAGGTAQSTNDNGRGRGAPVAVVPFIRASQEHRESAGIDVSRQITGADQDLGVFDVPAYGYLRNLVLVVTTSGGTTTSAVGAEDAPFNALKNIALQEPNGATIVQFNTGYEMYLANKYGGNRWGDARQAPSFSAIAGSTGHFAFLIRLPIEINPRDGLGALPNQNAAATFKLRLTLARSSDIYASGTLTTLPTVRVRAYLEAWDQPELQSAGQSNQTTPPAMNTTSYWSVQQFAVNAGSFNVRLTRMGNYIRQLIFLHRRTASTRANGDADWPDPLTLYWDTRPIDLIERNNWLQQIYERYGLFGTAEAAGARDLGVFPYDFMHEFDGRVGYENRDLWLPTLGSTRLELGGSFANAGTLTVIQNDVSVAGSVFL
jgi:hypothetical protein